MSISDRKEFVTGAGSVSFSGFGSGTITGSASSKSPEVELEAIPVDPEVEVEVEAVFACLTSGFPEVQLYSWPTSGQHQPKLYNLSKPHH